MDDLTSSFRPIPPGKTYQPVFAGKTADEMKITVYKHRDSENELYISLDDGDLQALPPDSIVGMSFDLDTAIFHIRIESPVWTGTASGSKFDLIEADAR